jgi:hypothetical protein
MKIIRHVQKLKSRGKSASMGWIKGYNDHPGNERADHLAGIAAEEIEPQLCGRGNEKSISWFKNRNSKEFTASSTTELQNHGKQNIIPPPPKKSPMDRARNSEARAVPPLRTNHWLSGVYLKRIKKRLHDGCWFCEPSQNSPDNPRMTRTHVLLRCVAFE